MSEQMYRVALTATGEVRDKDGNLVSSEPVEATFELTEAQLAELTEQGESK